MRFEFDEDKIFVKIDGEDEMFGWEGCIDPLNHKSLKKLMSCPKESAPRMTESTPVG